MAWFILVCTIGSAVVAGMEDDMRINTINKKATSHDYSKKTSKTGLKTDPAVSPVVGIMLMLTVTLILAAIISGFTGGIAKSQSKPPQLVFEASMVHDTDKINSFLDIRIISVSEGIPTRDLKLQTEWRNQTNQINRCTLTPHSENVGTDTYPRGFGPGVSEGIAGASNFGNFTLLAGTRLNANATISGAMDAVLTPYWDEITEGTPVRIQFVHVPSGAIIADKEITAET